MIETKQHKLDGVIRPCPYCKGNGVNYHSVGSSPQGQLCRGCDGAGEVRLKVYDNGAVNLEPHFTT